MNITPRNNNSSENQSTTEQGCDQTDQNEDLYQIDYKKEYYELKKEMKLLRENNANLNMEIQDFTSVLFEEAYKKIHSIEDEKSQALKRLFEAESKIDILNIQIEQFRQLIDDKTINDNKLMISKKKMYKNIKNKYSFKKNGLNTQDIDLKDNHDKTDNKICHNYPAYIIPLKKINCTTSLHGVMIQWFDKNKPFPSPLLEDYFDRDINLCLDFPNTKKTEELKLKLKISNPFICRINNPVNRICFYSEKECLCDYKLTFNENDEKEIFMCEEIRTKIVHVAEFWSYIRYTSCGLITATVEKILNEIMRRLINLSLVRIGFPPLLFEDIVYTENQQIN